MAAATPIATATCDIASATVLSGAHDHDHHGHEHRLLAARRLAETYTLEVGNTAGARYISCSVGTHCAQDQKVVITVTNSTSAASSDCSVSSSQGKNIAHSVAFLLPATLAASLWLLGEQQAGGAA